MHPMILPIVTAQECLLIRCFASVLQDEPMTKEKIKFIEWKCTFSNMSEPFLLYFRSVYVARHV